MLAQFSGSYNVLKIPYTSKNLQRIEQLLSMTIMNNQEIFDKVSAHLIKQGRVAVDANGNCKYRTEDGLMCAVGCLIDDEHYHPEIEGSHAGLPVVVEVLKKQGIQFDSDTIMLLRKLQVAHDRIHTTGNWNFLIPEMIKKLNIIADEFNLIYKHE